MWSGLSALLFLFGACASGPACTEGTDLCAYAAFKANTPVGAEEAAAAIRGMADPVVRAAAVQRWLGAHPNAAPQAGMKLCALLPPGEKENCDRRVNSPHLRR